MHKRQTFERYLSEHDERALFLTVRKFGDVYARRDEGWLSFMRNTGIRVGAMARFTCGDARNALRTGRVVVRGEISKGGNGYELHANKKACAALVRLLKVRRDMGHGEQPEGCLVVSRQAEGMSVRQYELRMKKWLAAAGLTVDASPHWLRHTVGKRIMQRSTSSNPLAIVQHALGHADIRNTAIYTYPDRDDIEQAMEAI